MTAVSVNILCNYLFIFVWGKGIAGAALASSLSEAASLLIVAVYAWVKVDGREFGLKPLYDKRLLAELLRLSL